MNPAHGPAPHDWSGFTIQAYSDLLDIAAAGYAFSRFGDHPDSRHVLWRHDIDFSVHRALRLARVEADKGLRATYFFMLASSFYNLMEPEVLARAREIAAIGHYVGLHLEVESVQEFAQLERQAERERDLLNDLLVSPVSAVSFHNPTFVDAALLTSDRIAGMTNAYGSTLMRQYTYCSDSNGYWRHRPLRDVLTVDPPQRLHVLTHPAWWTDEPMPPRTRIRRAIEGRAESVLRNYDSLLSKSGRGNLGS